MTPDDGRHGTPHGYNLGCRQPCCVRALARYRKFRKWRASNGVPLRPSAIGARRRVQALQAIGWTLKDLSQRTGLTTRTLNRIAVDQGGITEDGMKRIAALYDELSMTTGPSNSARLRALAKGHVPPLYWDDIDDPNAVPYQPSKVSHRAKTLEQKQAERETERAEFIAEAQLLVGTDTIANVVRRLGYTRADSIAARLRDYGQPELACKFEGAQREQNERAA